MSDRDEFEKYVLEDGEERYMLEKDSDGSYRWSETNRDWHVWQTARASAGAVPEGCVIVPTVPTEEMQKAWDKAPFSEDLEHEFISAWQAALTAAPAAPVEGGGVPEIGDDGKGSLPWFVTIYNSGYEAGHHDTVEGGFAPIHHSDKDTYHEEQVMEILEDLNIKASRDTRPHNGEQGDKRCSWWRDMADWDGNTWEADCGACWVFIDEGPAQNEMNYCPKCGRKLSQLPAPPAEREKGQ